MPPKICVSSARFFLGCFFSLILISHSAHAANCTIAQPHPLSAAQIDVLQGNYTAAESLYRDAIAKAAVDKTNDPQLTVGLVETLLREDKVDEAATTAKTALVAAPNSGPLLTVTAKVQHRQGLPFDERTTLISSSTLAPCYAPMHLQMANYLRFTSRWASAASELKVAHQLDPYDPYIQREWIQTLPLKDRIEELRKLVGNGSGDADSLRGMKHELAVLEDRVSEMENHQAGCHLVSEITSTDIPFTPMMIDPQHLSGWGLDVRFNDKNSHLRVDTGAGGLYISRSVAERAGLKPIATSQTGGVGDKGPQSGYTALAKSIKIGNLEFQNCLVEVSDSRNVVEDDGLIGMDVFSNFLVTLDFPWRKMTLGPLPPYPDAPAATPATLNTQQDSPEAGTSTTTSKDSKTVVSNGPHDRYVAPEMKDWDKIYRDGHMLIVPTMLSGKTTRLFIIDTGAMRTSVAPWAAREVTKVHRDDDMHVKGVAGKVNDVYMADKITFRFSHFNQEIDEVPSFDISRLSSNMGTEISGFFGFDLLHFMVLKIDYRDGLMDLEFSADRGYQHLRY